MCVCLCLGEAVEDAACVACPPAALKGGALAVSPGPAERHVTCMAIQCVCVCHVVGGRRVCV